MVITRLQKLDHRSQMPPGTPAATRSSPTFTPVSKSGSGARNVGSRAGANLQAVAGDAARWENFTFALTGKTKSQRTEAENTGLEQLRKEILSGDINPSFVFADGESDVLPDNVNGAFVAGTAGEQGRVILRPAMTAAQRSKTGREEFSEAVVSRAETLGISIADGDAGARGAIVLAGGTVTLTSHPDLFTSQPDDTAEVTSQGETVVASADASGSKTPSSDTVGHSGAPYVTSTTSGMIDFLITFDGADGTAPDGKLSAVELSHVPGISQAQAQQLVKVYGVADENGEYFIPASADPNSGDAYIGRYLGAGTDDMLEDGVLSPQFSGMDVVLFVDLTKVSGASASHAMMRAEGLRRFNAASPEEKVAKGVVGFTKEVYLGGMTAEQMDYASDAVFGDTKPLNSGNRLTLLTRFAGSNSGIVKQDDIQAMFDSGAIRIVPRSEIEANGGTPREDMIGFTVHTDEQRQFSSDAELLTFLMRFDLDGDGLDQHELSTGLSGIGLSGANVSPERAQRLINLYGDYTLSSDGTANWTIDSSSLQSALDDGALSFSTPMVPTIGGDGSRTYDQPASGVTINFDAVSAERIDDAVFKFTAANRKIPSAKALSLSYITAAELDGATDHLFGDWQPLRAEGANQLAHTFGVYHPSTQSPLLHRGQVANIFSSGAITIDDLGTGHSGHFVNLNVNLNARPSLSGPGQFERYVMTYAGTDGILSKSEFRQAVQDFFGPNAPSEVEIDKAFMFFSTFDPQVGRNLAGSGASALVSEGVFVISDAGAVTFKPEAVSGTRAHSAVVTHVAESRGVAPSAVTYVSTTELDAATIDIFGTSIAEEQAVIEYNITNSIYMSVTSLASMFTRQTVFVQSDGTLGVNPSIRAPSTSTAGSVDTPQNGYVVTEEDHPDTAHYGSGFYAGEHRVSTGQIHIAEGRTADGLNRVTIYAPSETAEPVHDQPGVYNPVEFRVQGPGGITIGRVQGHTMHRAVNPDGTVTWTIKGQKVKTEAGSKLDNYLSDYKAFSTPGSTHEGGQMAGQFNTLAGRPNLESVGDHTDEFGRTITIWAPRDHQFKTDARGNPVPIEDRAVVTINGQVVDVETVSVRTNSDGTSTYVLTYSNPDYDSTDPTSQQYFQVNVVLDKKKATPKNIKALNELENRVAEDSGLAFMNMIVNNDLKDSPYVVSDQQSASNAEDPLAGTVALEPDAGSGDGAILHIPTSATGPSLGNITIQSSPVLVTDDASNGFIPVTSSQVRSPNPNAMVRGEVQLNGTVTWTIDGNEYTVEAGSAEDRYLSDFKEYANGGAEGYRNGEVVERGTTSDGKEYVIIAPRQNQFVPVGETANEQGGILDKPIILVGGKRVKVTSAVVGESPVDGNLVIGISFADPDVPGQSHSIFIDADSAVEDPGLARVFINLLGQSTTSGTTMSLNEMLADPSSQMSVSYFHWAEAQVNEVANPMETQEGIDATEDVLTSEGAQEVIAGDARTLVREGIMLDSTAMVYYGIAEEHEVQAGSVYFVEEDPFLIEMMIADGLDPTRDILHVAPTTSGRRRLAQEDETGPILTDGTNRGRFGASANRGGVLITDHWWERQVDPVGPDSAPARGTHPRSRQRFNARVRYVGTENLTTLPFAPSITFNGGILDKRDGELRAFISSTGAISFNVTVEARYGHLWLSEKAGDGTVTEDYIFGEVNAGLSGRLFGTADGDVGSEGRSSAGFLGGGVTFAVLGQVRFRKYVKRKLSLDEADGHLPPNSLRRNFADKAMRAAGRPSDQLLILRGFEVRLTTGYGAGASATFVGARSETTGADSGPRWRAGGNFIGGLRVLPIYIVAAKPRDGSPIPYANDKSISLVTGALNAAFGFGLIANPLTADGFPEQGEQRPQGGGRRLAGDRSGGAGPSRETAGGSDHDSFMTTPPFGLQVTSNILNAEGGAAFVSETATVELQEMAATTSDGPLGETSGPPDMLAKITERDGDTTFFSVDAETGVAQTLTADQHQELQEQADLDPNAQSATISFNQEGPEAVGAAEGAVPGGGVVAANGGGVVAADNSGIEAVDNGGVVAANGTGVVAADGGDIVAVNGSEVVVAAGGGFVAADGSGVVAADGSGVVAVDSGGIVAASGGGVAASSGGGVVAADGGPIAAIDGGDVHEAPGGGFVAAGNGDVVVPLEIEPAAADPNHVNINVDADAVVEDEQQADRADPQAIQTGGSSEPKNAWVYVGRKKIYYLAPVSLDASATADNSSPALEEPLS